MNRIMKALTQLTWLSSGILALLLLAMAIPIVVDARVAAQDIRELWSLVTIEDMRQALDIIDKQLEADLLELKIEQQRSDVPLRFTPENWQAFIDFCGRTGYVVSDENWQRYIHGKLIP